MWKSCPVITLRRCMVSAASPGGVTVATARRTVASALKVSSAAGRLTSTNTKHWPCYHKYTSILLLGQIWLHIIWVCARQLVKLKFCSGRACQKILPTALPLVKGSYITFIISKHYSVSSSVLTLIMQFSVKGNNSRCMYCTV